MGKWATYKRRGTAELSAPPLPPPPAPTMGYTSGFLFQDATGDDDPGGQIILETSPDGVSDWIVERTTDWEGSYIWGGLIDPGPGWYRGREVGSGVEYAGTSDPSNVVQVM